MEAKIADLDTTGPNRDLPMSMVPVTQNFMPPEVLVNDPDTKYGKELDVFSFGCIMLHTFSQQWPTSSQHVVTDPIERTLIARSEIERRAQYLDKVHKVVEDVMVPLIVSCLENLPFDRLTIMKVCDQLETLVVNKISNQNPKIEVIRSEMSKIQVNSPHVPPKQVASLLM